MSLQLYFHRFSSYSQKALIAFHEYDLAYEPRHLDGPDCAASQELARLWPMRRFPVLVDGARMVFEATSVIEHLTPRAPPEARLIPADADAAVEVRMLDRFFDNYVATPQQKVVFDALRPEGTRDPHGAADARRMLETSYAWLEARMAGREWAAGERFSLADCAAAPHLFYADWTHPIGPAFPLVTAYRQRLLARPSFARCVDDARPYRAYFPLGAPDRD
jgi:glutathione S-transferase